MKQIDVDVLVEWIENWFTKNRLHHPYAKNNNIPITELYDILEQIPTIEPEPKWIPVSEMLPEDGQNVLVTYKTTDKIHPCQYHDDESRNPWYSYIDQCRAHMNVVLAWMPLPEPYREEGD